MSMSNQVTRHCANAVTALISAKVGMPSHMRSSTVPNPGWGRMSHQTSRTVEMLPARMSASRNISNSPQPLNCGGSPAVGRISKIFVRVLARPVFSDSRKGLEQLSASRCGRKVVKALTVAMDFSADRTPTCTWTP